MKTLYEEPLGDEVVYGFQFGEKQKKKEFLDNLRDFIQKIPIEEIGLSWEDAGSFQDREGAGWYELDNILNHWSDLEKAPWNMIDVEGVMGDEEVSFGANACGSGQEYPYLTYLSEDPDNDELLKYIENYKPNK